VCISISLKTIPLIASNKVIIDVELTTLQKQYYRAIFDKNRAFLYKASSSSGAGGGAASGTTTGAAADRVATKSGGGGQGRAKGPQLMNIQMELRKCCNHPFLVEGVEQVSLASAQGL
jgi:chromodomain-helicase-DNA-binding protein 7